VHDSECGQRVSLPVGVCWAGGVVSTAPYGFLQVIESDSVEDKSLTWSLGCVLER
jgi:hypothetical protein